MDKVLYTIWTDNTFQATIPVILFGIGYFIKDRLTHKTKIKNLLYEMLCNYKIFSIGTYHGIIVCGNLISQIQSTCKMTKELHNLLLDFTKEVNKKNSNQEFLNSAYSKIIINISKQAHWFSFNNKYKYTDDICNYFLYYPSITAQYHYGEILSKVSITNDGNKMKIYNMMNTMETEDLDLVVDYMNYLIN